MDKTIKLFNKTGLHARPAALFVNTASKYKSNIEIVWNEKRLNAKSIMNILSFGLTMGDKITISATGEDEKEAIDSLVNLIESKFGEE
ncbi:HPr family phosphocarrier protein [Wukongibacter sp. M2B1]|uniref:HPr family phosphocarrier protein n=1 Tax=Wukongibacter sp. M2B1 TaxID=3088895 RepID=UPI003D79F7A9